MSGVVWAHGQLVDRDILFHNRSRGTRSGGDDAAGILLRGKGEKLHCQHASHTEFGGYLDAYLHRTLRERCRQVRGRGKSLSADPISLHGLGDRPGFDLAGGAAGDEHR